MADLEKIIEEITADLVMVDLEDLPALSQIHEKFESLAKSDVEGAGEIISVAKGCAELLKKIILSEIQDKKAAMKALNEAVTVMQQVIRDGKSLKDFKVPEILEIGNGSATKDKGDSGSSKTAAESVEEDIRYTMHLTDADSSLIGEFITEAREHCSNAEQMLMNLETGEDKEGSINAIFRSFHTIKGAAGFLDLQPINVVSHESETLLDMGRKGTVKIEGRIADVIFDSIDILRQLLEAVEDTLSSGAEYDATEQISPILGRLRQLISNPEASDISEPSDRIGDKLIDMGVTSQKKIDEALRKKSSPDEKIGQTLVKQQVVPAKAVAKALREQQQVRKEKQAATSAVKEMVKIDTERLDRMVDTIGELVIAESMVGQNEELLSKASHEITRNISHLNKITRELQEMGMAMRLVPVRGTFQKLARAVRDLTRKSGKQVELNLFGEDTEVDRSITDLIGDPLMHMIRNAVDHGIESPDDRVGYGKPVVGTVTLKAYHKGGSIYFEIEDDGHGLDKEKIYKKAVEKGLLEPGKELTDTETYSIILMPGFSTAQKVTDISGRGVGMDVVKKNIDAMRGNLEIDSELGRGTKFVMKLPLTLAIIDGMLVDIEDEKYIIPTLSVVESLSLTQDMISTVTSRGELINLRGELLPLIRVNRLFGLPEKSDDENAEHTVVVVEDNARKIGLVVNKLLGQRQTVIKSLGKTFSRQKWISGGAILSNGNIGLIIDIGGVISLADELKRELYADRSKNRLKKYLNNNEPETITENIPEISRADHEASEMTSAEDNRLKDLNAALIGEETETAAEPVSSSH